MLLTYKNNDGSITLTTSWLLLVQTMSNDRREKMNIRFYYDEEIIKPDSGDCLSCLGTGYDFQDGGQCEVCEGTGDSDV